MKVYEYVKGDQTVYVDQEAYDILSMARDVQEELYDQVGHLMSDMDTPTVTVSVVNPDNKTIRQAVMLVDKIDHPEIELHTHTIRPNFTASDGELKPIVDEILLTRFMVE